MRIGADYYPEHWEKERWKTDAEMMVKANIKVIRIGEFAWSLYEPEEGKYEFDWMDEALDFFGKYGIKVVMCTPSATPPKWMIDKYPDILQNDIHGNPKLFGTRKHYCFNSETYREKTKKLNTLIAKRYAKHPAIEAWQVDNELGWSNTTRCYCKSCENRFRNWLKEKYQTIENLNDKWCTTFWSHTYNSFDQIESPSKIGETQLHALNLDWKRFVTHQTADFIHHEIAALREGGSTLPTTANLMYYFGGLDYFKIAKEIDVVSWDTYPTWHKEAVIDTAYDNGMCHDLMRSLKGKPFFQMESCPASTNWQSVSKLKKPGMLFAQSMQAIAHGGEGALYFQIRQSRGASEKFHGAVIDHYGGNDTRVFKEVSRVGEVLKELKELAGTTVNSSVAMLYDWDSQWAMEDSQGPRNKGLHYLEAMLKFYRGFRKQGVNVDVIDMTCELDKYKVLALPMVYMFKEGFAKKVRAFVENGGTLITSYWSGIADDTDRCYLEGTPHGLMDVLGIRSTEIDGLYDWEENSFVPVAGNELGLDKTYTCKYLCDLVELRGARTLMTYGSDFYEGYSCLTVNEYGKGKAWYVAADADKEFYGDFLEKVLKDSGVSCGIKEEIPDALEITVRENENEKYYIYQNFGTEAVSIPVPEGEISWIYGNGSDKLKVYGLAVAKVIV